MCLEEEKNRATNTHSKVEATSRRKISIFGMLLFQRIPTKGPGTDKQIHHCSLSLPVCLTRRMGLGQGSLKRHLGHSHSQQVVHSVIPPPGGEGTKIPIHTAKALHYRKTFLVFWIMYTNALYPTFLNQKHYKNERSLSNVHMHFYCVI